MILDSFKPNSLIFQMQYPKAYEIWDRAGAIGRGLCGIWPGIKILDSQPLQQIFAAPGVNVQIGIDRSTVALVGAKVFEDKNTFHLKESFELWREHLAIKVVERISTRVIYSREFATLRLANAELFGLKLAAWPQSKVFDQSTDSEKNGLEIAYRFEDANSFSVLRLKAEEVKVEVELDSEFFEESKLQQTKRRMLIDFDRGLLGSVDAGNFRLDEWIKGFQHVLRRDIEKVVKANT